MSPTRSPRRHSKSCPGTIAIGHVRYSTAGDSKVDNAQPILIECAHGQIAIAHNGNLVNAERAEGRARQARIDLPDQHRYRSDSSSVCAIAGGDERRGDRRGHFTRAGRLLARADDEGSADRRARSARVPSFGARAPRRRRHRLLGDVRARPDRRHLRSRRRARRGRDRQRRGREVVQAVSRRRRRRSACSSTCISRVPTATYSVRASTKCAPKLGRLLAREKPVAADVIVPVPDSGVCAAIGFAEESDIPMRVGLIRNHYVGRTFIEPQQSIRHFGVRVKLNPVRSILEGRRVVLVDDSLVRGTTSRKIVKMVKAAGAKEVHMRISCPPDDIAVFLRRRHAAAVRADRGHAHARRDSEVHRRGQRRLSEPRRASFRCGDAPLARTARRATPDSIRWRSLATKLRICSWR